MVYIQSNNERTLPHHFDASCAMWGAIETGLDYRLTSFEEIQSGKFDALLRKNLFVGSVEFMKEVFTRMGLDAEKIRVPMNSDREHEIITLGQAKERVSKGEKIFIKPLGIKLFTGFVLDQCKYTCLNNIPDDTKIMAYEPFKYKIASEWRLYVHNNQIIDARNYAGNFSLIPNIKYWQETLKRSIEKPEDISIPFRDFPCAYSIDIGILEPHEQSVVIEFNDGWSLGSYGTPNDLYLQMLNDRYFEIVKNGK